MRLNILMCAFLRASIEKIVLFLFVVYMLNNLFLDGMLVFIKLPDEIRFLPVLINYLNLLTAMLCVCCTQYTKRERLVVLVGYLLMALTFWTSREATLIVTWTWLVLVKNVPYDKWIRCSLYCNGIGVVAGILATVTGIHKDLKLQYRNVSIRYTFGFGQPNFTGNILFLIAASYCWLKKGEMKAKDYAILLGFIFVCYVFPNSLGTTIVLLVFAILLFIFQFLLRNELAKKKALKILFYGAVACAVSSIILGTIDVSRFPVLARIDALISYRFTDVYRTYEKCGFSLLGQTVDFEALKEYAHLHGEARSYYMDCMWMYLPVHYGILFSAVFIYVYFSAMYIFVKRGDVLTVIIFFSGALYAMEQQIWPSLVMWIFMVFLAERLFQVKWNNKRKKVTDD